MELPNSLGHWYALAETPGQLHHLYEQTGNPLYVWEAIARCLNADQPIPDWCIPYLRDTAIRLSQLALGHDSDKGEIAIDQAPHLVAKALLLSRQGKNAFADLATDKRDVIQAQMATTEFPSIAPFLRKLGLQLIQKTHSITLDRAKRILARGKRLARPAKPPP